MFPKASKDPTPSPPSTPETTNPITLTDLYAHLFHNSRSSTPSPTIHIPPTSTRAQIAAILAVELRNDHTTVVLPVPDSSSSKKTRNNTLTNGSAKELTAETPNESQDAASSPKLPDAPAEPVELRKGIDYPLDAFDRTPSDARERLAEIRPSRSSRLLYDEELLASPLLRTASEMSSLDPQELSIIEGNFGGC